jgi:putative aldouronate transport system substrate-binding protein
LNKINFIQREDLLATSIGVVSTSCPNEKLETTLRWLDYGYTEEGFTYWNFGKEDVSYTMKNGKPVYTDLVTKDPMGLAGALNKYVGTTIYSVAIQAEDMNRQKNQPAAIAAVDTWVKNTEAEKHIYPTGVTMTTAESDEYTNLASQIGTYISEMALKFLTGDESLDKYDTFVKTLKKMGIDRMLEIRQTAYDRFLKR